MAPKMWLSPYVTIVEEMGHIYQMILRGEDPSESYEWVTEQVDGHPLVIRFATICDVAKSTYNADLEIPDSVDEIIDFLNLVKSKNTDLGRGMALLYLEIYGETRSEQKIAELCLAIDIEIEQVAPGTWTESATKLGRLLTI